ncbi:MAG: complex I NDUFA9 subunit family protein [Kiloniellales bacterium]|nr:complex I NDUFA9 subunit family protein [Kiloniellales bacterium]
MALVATVFGGSGFVGRSIVQTLASRGWRIRVAVRRPRQARDLQPLGTVGQITAIAAKVQDPVSVRAAVDGADLIVNLTGLLYESGDQSFEAVHVEGAAGVASAAKEAGAGRLIHMSALGADASAAPAYARTKGRGEAAVREVFPEAAILRPSIVFGPDDDFFNRFARMALISPALPLIGGGTARFQPVYVGDLAESVAAILVSRKSFGQTYELAGPEIFSFRQLLEIMLEEIGRKRILLPLSYDFAGFIGGAAETACGLAASIGLPVAPPLTRDQVAMLRRDNVASGKLPGLKDLGIEATALGTILPTYMDCYRVGGRYMKPKQI